MLDENDALRAGILPMDPAVDSVPWRPPEPPPATPAKRPKPKGDEAPPPAPDPRDREGFEARWAEADERQRDHLLRALLARVDELDALQKGRLWGWLRDLTGLGIRVLRAAAAEAKAGEEGAPDYPEPADGGACIDYVTNRDSVGALFDQITQVLAASGIWFGTEREIVKIEGDLGPRAVTPDLLPGKLGDLTEIRFLNVGKHEDYPMFQRFGPLPADLSRAFCASTEARQSLPPLAQYIRAPQFSRDWTWIATPGYHAADGGTFYAGPPVEPAPEGSTLKLLPQLLDQVCWKEPADLANFVGALLTCITMPHWSDGTHPALVVNANRPDAGKTTLVQLLAILWEGQEAKTITFSHDDVELEKQLGTVVREGGRVLLMDNIKSRLAISSAVLEKNITAKIPHFRHLGFSESISRPQNDLFYALTMNDTVLGKDMRSRAMPINLHLPADRPEGAPDPKAFALLHRAAILGELAAIVLRWLKLGRPLPESPARYAKGDVWAASIDAMLRPWGLTGFMSNVEAAKLAFDSRFKLVLELAEAFEHEGVGTAGQWVGRLEAANFGDQVGFRTRRGSKTPKQKEHVVITLFKDFLDKPLVDEDADDGRAWVLERVEVSTSKGMRPGYVFRPLS